MLSILLPSVAAYWICSKRAVPVKMVASLVVLVALNHWFKVVLIYRGSHDMTAFGNAVAVEEVHHHGLDMLKELCFINQFIESGTYLPNWGRRYFAEAVNFVPRGLWPGKPMIGLDYAVARGFGSRSNQMGVNATIATGLIGQGVVNFGRVFGVAFVAWLCALWIGFLARLWMQRGSMLRLLLFLVGLGVTFNCGRDVTFLVLFPFAFGYVFVRILERLNPKLARTDLP